MPDWILVLAVVIAGWLVLSVGGGLAIGRLLALVSRHLPHTRRRPV